MTLSSLLAVLLFVAFSFVGQIEASRNLTSWIPGFKSCHYQGRIYPVGSSFHPLVKFRRVAGIFENICINCSCNPTTLVQCKKIVCPSLNCSDPIRLDGECCSRCPNDEINLIAEGDMLHCSVNGVRYEHGQLFHPPENGTNSFCSSCKCNNGTAHCQNISSLCPEPFGCPVDKQYVPEGRCCKVCPIPDLSNGECLDERNYVRKSNESWSPHYGSIVVNCINCTCHNSSVKCEKLPCPPVPPCGPNDPEETIVICCPKCSREPITPATSIPPPLPTPSISPEPFTCSNPKYTHKVYLCHDEYGMAIEDTRNDTVQLYNWLSGTKNIQYMSSKAFRLSNCAKNSDSFKGYALERRVNGLSNKESKVTKIESCVRGCAKMVANMLRPTLDSNLCN